jgi:hypothetical protein
MTEYRAFQIINRVWGSAEVISLNEIKEVEAAAIGQEKVLETLCRVAGITLAHVWPFSAGCHHEVRRIVTMRELELTRENPYFRFQR